MLQRREAALTAQPEQVQQLTPSAEYALLRIRSAYLAPQPSSGAVKLPAMKDIFSGSAERLLGGDAAAWNTHSKRLRQVERQVFASAAPALDSAAFGSAAAELAMSEIRRLQHWLQRAAQQVQLMDDLIPKLSQRPSEQRKLRAAKQRLQQRMRPELYSLVRWLSGGYVGYDGLPGGVRAYAASVSDGQRCTVGAAHLLSVCLLHGHSALPKQLLRPAVASPALSCPTRTPLPGHHARATSRRLCAWPLLPQRPSAGASIPGK